MASAAISPAGCNTSNLQISVQRVPSPLHNHDTEFYTVTVSNLQSVVPGESTCDVTGVVVTFQAPAADGTATGAITVLDPGSDYPVGRIQTYPTIPVVLNLNPTVTVAAASATANGILQDFETGNPPDTATATKTVSVVIVHPSVAITKTVTPLTSKAGDSVTYHICIQNTSDDNDTLNVNSVIDSILGDITASFPASLNVGDPPSCADFTYTVKPTDPDPLVNTVTVTATDTAANPQTKTASASATVDLIHPSVAITKTPSMTDACIGDPITYTIVVTNTSSDAGLVNVDVNDTLGGTLLTGGSLAPGGSATLTYTIPAALPTPMTNIVTVHANPVNPQFPGVTFTNDITAEARALVNVSDCTPGLSITKSATPGLTKAGDTVTYHICIENTGDLPLTDVVVTDTLLGPLSGFPTSLAVGSGPFCLDFTRQTVAGDPNPLVNTATVTAVANKPDGSSTTLTQQASASVPVVHPSFTISKACSPDPVSVGATLTWTITLVNTGDISLDITTVDPTMGVSQTDTVAAGVTKTITATHVVVAGDTSPITNTATATAILTGSPLPNVIGPQSSTASCTIPPTGGPTRTPGYWFTHPQQLLDAYKCITGSTTGTITFCGSCKANANDAMAIFWQRGGAPRSTLAFQILAAMFNECEFGTLAPDSIIANAIAVLCNPSATNTEIGAVISPLDAFNQSGDNIAFPPGFVNTSANTDLAKSMAAAGTVPVCANSGNGRGPR